MLDLVVYEALLATLEPVAYLCLTLLVGVPLFLLVRRQALSALKDD